MGYITLLRPGIAEFTVQRSRFIAQAAPAADEAAAQAFLQRVRKEYYDARHNCSAWVLEADGSRQRSSDDGEPGGTAGMPILEVIRRRGVTNCVVVVTRYFGGIKLGAGGLTRAYSHAAAIGLDAAVLAEVRTMRRLAVTVAYPLLEPLERWLRQDGVDREETLYAEDVTLNLLVEPEKMAAIQAAVTDRTAGRARMEAGDETEVVRERPQGEMGDG